MVKSQEIPGSAVMTEMSSMRPFSWFLIFVVAHRTRFSRASVHPLLRATSTNWRSIPTALIPRLWTSVPHLRRPLLARTSSRTLSLNTWQPASSPQWEPAWCPLCLSVHPRPVGTPLRATTRSLLAANQPARNQGTVIPLGPVGETFWGKMDILERNHCSPRLRRHNPFWNHLKIHHRPMSPWIYLGSRPMDEYNYYSHVNTQTASAYAGVHCFDN